MIWQGKERNKKLDCQSILWITKIIRRVQELLPTSFIYDCISVTFVVFVLVHAVIQFPNIFGYAVIICGCFSITEHKVNK